MIDPISKLSSSLLAGKKGLVVGVANDHSIASGCARAFAAAGAELVLTCQSEKARPFAQPVADAVGAKALISLDVADDEAMKALPDQIEGYLGGLDFLLHSVAFSPKDDLHGRVIDCSKDGFLMAMDISCHSFMRLGHLFEPMLEARGGSLLTVSYYGADKVAPKYNLMGPVKAALEASARAMAVELGPKGIRVNVISPGAIPTRAASGLADFQGLVNETIERSPIHRLVTPDEVGAMAAVLVSDLAQALNGELLFIDGGMNILA